MSIRKKKILAFTGIRSDYDLLSGIYRKLQENSSIELRLVVSGAHLSCRFGYTVTHIEKDNIPILCKIESLIDSDTKSSRIQSASLLIQGCIHTVMQYSPDVIIYAGDREDALVAALIGAYANIPTVHFFGGDHATDGNVDNPVRHAISKLSSIHFVIHECHLKRLLAIGEEKERIHVVGNPALDRFENVPYIPKKELMIRFEKKWEEYAVLIHHPILGYEDKAGIYFEEILIALKQKNVKAFVSYPNIDAGNRKTIETINKYEKDRDFFFFKNFDRNVFINLMRNASFMIGNSSSGIIEAAIIPLGVVNVGERQKGRLSSVNVIFVDQGIENIKTAIDRVLSEEFQINLKKTESIYGDGNSIASIVEKIITIDFSQYTFKTKDPLK